MLLASAPRTRSPLALRSLWWVRGFFPLSIISAPPRSRTPRRYACIHCQTAPGHATVFPVLFPTLLWPQLFSPSNFGLRLPLYVAHQDRIAPSTNYSGVWFALHELMIRSVLHGHEPRRVNERTPVAGGYSRQRDGFGWMRLISHRKRKTLAGLRS